MKSEYDFSASEQGKFYHPDATFHYPIYLEADVEQFVTKIAETKNIDVQVLVNEWLRNNIKLIQSIE
ncbi:MULTISPECIES: hypothetical protein [unclassified Microcoleus]|uniref:hypothetical protein n=1 Tax=unclassified Microcoleus TaxID=2642155 RepID=UPI001D8C1AE9|nr:MULTISPECIES: hypothetical protein [unclassified Microcoleus]TAE68605.1 MAG: hypothetical protein EAZ86_12830 [Oscillatoriales cyanobacterium]MCC3439949.1 hypothetical protein [Microcoleus sp. PH2017_05_CCC_O_A]MCC3584411.1 hypothetical protein [Microcoleus sp. PH2017_30_WIL_O_A]MCC3592633.1 hypothetical protein [Microcoleus sp. PH2017_28_MFU_U_A]TAG62118.1 MAG: hypothetical protein EAZ28_03415 [Oscillatoriales cyanobacterium]